jgi:hypothetical protein
MTRIDESQPLDPVLQRLSNEIKTNWRLGDIADALPGRLDPARVLGPKAKNAFVESNWGLALLTGLRELSIPTKEDGAHDEVKYALNNLLDDRRASETSSHEQWTIVSDVKNLIDMYGAPASIKEDGPRRSVRIKAKVDGDSIQSGTPSAVRGASKTKPTVSTPTSRLSRKRKATAEGEDDHYEQRSIRRKRNTRGQTRKSQEEHQPSETGDNSVHDLAEDRNEPAGNTDGGGDNDGQRPTDDSNGEDVEDGTPDNAEKDGDGHNGVRSPSENLVEDGQDGPPRDAEGQSESGQEPHNGKDQEVQTEVDEVTDRMEDLSFDQQNPMPAGATPAERTALWRLLQRRNNFLRAAEPDLRGARDIKYAYYMMVSDVGVRLENEAARERVAIAAAAAAMEDVE